MTLAVVGMGLVSPFGCSPREHVLFRRAHVPGPFAPPFKRADGEPTRVYFCPWLDAGQEPAERMAELASTALEEALCSYTAAGWPAPALRVCMARARPGLDQHTHEAITDALQTRYRPPSMGRFWAEAGVFAALKEAEGELARDDVGAIAIVAVDSHVSLDWLTHHVQSPPTRWEADRPRPSEAAAALLVMSPKSAQRFRLPALARVHKSALAMGLANDDNDEPVDALPMGAALRELGQAPVLHAFGQGLCDDLRREEWHRAIGRQASRFWDCQHDCLESDIGAVGAAAGAGNLVYGATALRLGALAPGPFVAWAISRDGTRGVASLSVEESHELDLGEAGRGGAHGRPRRGRTPSRGFASRSARSRVARVQ